MGLSAKTASVTQGWRGFVMLSWTGGLVGLGFAKFFGELFAVAEGDCVETVQYLDVEDKCCPGQGEEDRNQKPGTIEVVGQEYPAVADSEAGDDDAHGDEGAEL